MTSVLTACRSGRTSGGLSVACITGLVFIFRRQYKIILNTEDGFRGFDTILSVARYWIILVLKVGFGTTTTFICWARVG